MFSEITLVFSFLIVILIFFFKVPLCVLVGVLRPGRELHALGVGEKAGN